MFTGIGAFSAQNYYSCPKAGLVSGAAPFTAGVLFVMGDYTVVSGIFGDHDGTGFGFFAAPGAAAQGGAGYSLFGQSGSDPQGSGFTGTVGAAVGAAGAAYGVGVVNTLNAEFSMLHAASGDLNGSVNAPGASVVRNFATPFANRMVLLVQRYDGVNESFFFNGQLVGTRSYTHTSNANPLVIGNLAGGPATSTLVMGAFYHAAAVPDAQVGAIMAASAACSDLVSPALYYGPTFDLDYVWSAKTGNYDARANWYSKGRQPPLAMVRSGAPLAVAVNYPWA